MNKLTIVQCLNQIREDVKWVSQNIDKQYSLNLNTLRLEQKKMRATVKELDSLTKLAASLNVTALSSDDAKITASKNNTDINKQWLQRVSDDIYIDETVKVLNSMIKQAALSKSK